MAASDPISDVPNAWYLFAQRFRRSYNYDVTSALAETAKEEGLDYAIDVYPHYGSDVEATLRAGYDIRHGLIGPGVYASHNYERSIWMG